GRSRGRAGRASRRDHAPPWGRRGPHAAPRHFGAPARAAPRRHGGGHSGGDGGGVTATGLEWLPEALRDLRERELLRTLTYCAGAPGPEVEIAGVPHLLLASNNYLGLADAPRVVGGARAALEAYGAGAGASRLVTGSLDLHRRLEERIAALKRTEDAMVF